MNLFYTKNLSFSKIKKQMKQPKDKFIASLCSSILPMTLLLSVFVLIVEIMIYLWFGTRMLLVRARSGWYRPYENKCPRHIHIYAWSGTAGEKSMPPAWHFDRNALKERKRLIESIGYRRQTDEIEKRKRNSELSQKRSLVSYPSHAPRTKSPSFFVKARVAQ